ncbi:hypothetical protein HOY82DRAFT_606367 [Tuber indicum]|nr:hypothetical protein HOY82DRAFT_606367 [Tuber indicum]
MPRRRGSTRGSSQTSADRRGTSGGIRKSTRSRQVPRRYGQNVEDLSPHPESVKTHTMEEESEQMQASEPTDSRQNTPTESPSAYDPARPDTFQSEIPVSRHEPTSLTGTCSPIHEGVTLDDMRQLLRSHANDIVDQVVRRLRPQSSVASPTHHGCSRSIPDVYRQQLPGDRLRYGACGALKNTGPRQNSPPQPARRPGAGPILWQFTAKPPRPAHTPGGALSNFGATGGHNQAPDGGGAGLGGKIITLPSRNGGALEPKTRPAPPRNEYYLGIQLLTV